MALWDGRLDGIRAARRGPARCGAAWRGSQDSIRITLRERVTRKLVGRLDWLGNDVWLSTR
uniref:Uncharacterized protein n=1 Tax=Oryza glumipatula TaxID=40148 RepID=A0A0D9YYP6_9ORYZ